MNNDHLFFKLMLRRFLLKQRGHTAFRSALLGNFRTVPEVVFNTVLAECIREGCITDQYGPKHGILYTWHEEAVEVNRG